MWLIVLTILAIVFVVVLIRVAYALITGRLEEKSWKEILWDVLFSWYVPP